MDLDLDLDQDLDQDLDLDLGADLELDNTNIYMISSILYIIVYITSGPLLSEYIAGLELWYSFVALLLQINCISLA